MKPTTDQILEAAIEFLRDDCNYKPSGNFEDATNDSLGVDSLDLIECVIHIEDKLGIEITDEAMDFRNDHTLRQCAEQIERHLT